MATSNSRTHPPRVIPAGDRRLTWLVALLGVLCVLRAAQYAWFTDDAFISFRYARNLVDGLGLVFNAGEHVEGYTNLLWTLAIAALMRLGFAPELMAHVLGIVCWLALSVVLAWWSWQRARLEGRVWLPFAALLNLALPDAQRWATGGLETSMFSLLTTSGLVLLAARAPRRGPLMAAGTILALACTTRPDGVLFAALGVAYAFCMPPAGGLAARVRAASWVALPLIAVGTALVAFKLHYYGDLFPTAFYTKSPLRAYYSQGLYYFWLFFARNWFALLFVLCAWWPLRRRLATLVTASNGLFLAAFATFAFYVVHSAGDYMYARRLMPALPFLWLMFEDLLWRCPSRQTAVALLVVALFTACLPRHLDADYPRTLRGIANEWTLFPSEYIQNSRAQAAVAERLLSNLPVRGIFQGGMCMFAYYSRLPYLAEMTGLTQYSLAKQPITTRGRIGHEKSANEAWLTENHIHMVFFHENPPLVENGTRRFELVRFDNILTAMIWKYSDAVMDPLRARPEVDFVPIELVLAQAESDIKKSSASDAEQILAFLERYYLADAPPARAPLAAHLRQLVADKRSGTPPTTPGVHDEVEVGHTETDDAVEPR